MSRPPPTNRMLSMVLCPIWPRDALGYFELNRCQTLIPVARHNEQIYILILNIRWQRWCAGLISIGSNI